MCVYHVRIINEKNMDFQEIKEEYMGEIGGKKGMRRIM